MTPSRRRLLRLAGAGGVGVAGAWGLSAYTGGVGDWTTIEYALARADPDSTGLQPRTKEVPREWLENLELAFEVQEKLRAANLSSLLGSFTVPGTYDQPEASVAVEATDEGIGERLKDLSQGLSIDLEIIEELPDQSGGGASIEDAYKVDDVDRKHVPSGVVCRTKQSFGTLAPALYSADSGHRYFTTSNHVFGEIGQKETEHEGQPLSLNADGITRQIGRVERGYPLADVVAVEPVDGYEPMPEIARISPRTVIGQYTKAGLADLVARGEEIEKMGAMTDHTSGRIKGIDGVTCYTGEICKHGQLKWGDQDTLEDGDSGSVNYHADPENPQKYVLVGGINNARTWWPGADFTWGTAAHHLLDEYEFHF